MGLYEKPVIKSYSADDLLEVLGPSQSQYGQDGGPTQETTLYTTTGNSAVNVDGYVYSTGTVEQGASINAGDYETVRPDASLRGFVGFDISSIQGRTIVSATLRVYETVTGDADEVYLKLGNLVVDHVNFGSNLDSSDHSGGTLTSNIGTISTSGTSEWKTLDVTTYVQADVDAAPTRTSSQYRLRFTTDINDDGINDVIRIEDADNTRGTGNIPELVVSIASS